MTSSSASQSGGQHKYRRLQWILIAVVLMSLGQSALLVRGYYSRHADHKRIAEPAQPINRVRAALPLRLSEGGRYLVDSQGNPFLIHGEAAWSLVAQLTREDAEIYLEDRRQRGVNLIVVNLIEHWFADHAPQNVYGQSPFKVAGDFATPNDAYFEYAREIVRMASSKGIVILLCPAYLGGDGGHEGWYQDMRRNGPDILRSYGRHVGERFRDFDNVVWLDGGDFTPPAGELRLIRALAEGVRAAAPSQLHTGHFSPETSALDVALGFPFDFNTTYTYLPAYVKGLRDNEQGHGGAHFLIESKYEDDDLGSTQKSLRSQAYYSLLTGGMGQVHGNRWVWTFTRPTLWRRLLGKNWKSALDSPSTRSMGHLKRLFAELSWWTLVPDATYEVQISGQGTTGTLEHPVLSRSQDGRLAVAYVPTLQGIQLDLKVLAGNLRARWYDPTNGQFANALGHPLGARGEQQFTPPGTNAAGDGDWLLLLKSETAANSQRENTR